VLSPHPPTGGWHPEVQPLGRTTAKTPFLQISESKSGKPALDYVGHPGLSLKDGARLGLVSQIIKRRSNLNVSPPFEIALVPADGLQHDEELRGVGLQDRERCRHGSHQRGHLLRSTLRALQQPVGRGSPPAALLPPGAAAAELIAEAGLPRRGCVGRRGCTTEPELPSKL
jgi:hypothetical protein